jgi:hypothetical protein
MLLFILFKSLKRKKLKTKDFFNRTVEWKIVSIMCLIAQIVLTEIF